ncbi:hypothetical protein A3K73_05410 [Candidatus Pacearchaeota archaeon RBG_13_36_9]|nr:MAG: hypothetical protein A3K73_05410 [Candidatus Pacearchaeota archaeon RBG_13_36_9]
MIRKPLLIILGFWIVGTLVLLLGQTNLATILVQTAEAENLVAGLDVDIGSAATNVAGNWMTASCEEARAAPNSLFNNLTAKKIMLADASFYYT